MRLVTFVEVNGEKVAVNPDRVTWVVNVGNGVTDINFDHGRDLRVRGAFETVVARLCGKADAASA